MFLEKQCFRQTFQRQKYPILKAGIFFAHSSSFQLQNSIDREGENIFRDQRSTDSYPGHICPSRRLEHFFLTALRALGRRTHQCAHSGRQHSPSKQGEYSEPGECVNHRCIAHFLVLQTPAGTEMSRILFIDYLTSDALLDKILLHVYVFLLKGSQKKNPDEIGLTGAKWLKFKLYVLT